MTKRERKIVHSIMSAVGAIHGLPPSNPANIKGIAEFAFHAPKLLMEVMAALDNLAYGELDDAECDIETAKRYFKKHFTSNHVDVLADRDAPATEATDKVPRRKQRGTLST